MPADLTKPFAESCCDGGKTYINDNSCQPCGCDAGAGWICQRHNDELTTLNMPKEKSVGKLKKHLIEVVNVTWNFAKRLKTPQDHEMNALIGLASEAGELLDVGKKMWFHSEKPAEFYREKILYELGDIVYYLLKVMDVFGFTMKEVLDANRAKLASRHPELGEVKERFSGDYIR